MSDFPTEKPNPILQTSSQREDEADVLPPSRKTVPLRGTGKREAATLQQRSVKQEQKGREEGSDQEEGRAHKRGRVDTFEEGKKRVCLRNLDFPNCAFHVPSDEKISTATKMIALREGASIEKLLYFRDSPVPNTLECLDSWDNMRFFDLDLGARKNIFYEEKQFFRIFCKFLTGKTFPLRVSSDNTIWDVMRQIKEKEGVPCEQQRLIFGGKLREHHETLAECSVQEDCTLNLILRLQGS